MNNQNLDKLQQVKNGRIAMQESRMRPEFEYQPTPDFPQATVMNCTASDAKQSHTEKKQQYNNGKDSSSSLNHGAVRRIILQHLPNLFLTGPFPKCLNILLFDADTRYIM